MYRHFTPLVVRKSWLILPALTVALATFAQPPGSTQAAVPAKPKLLVDFEDPQAVRVGPNQVEATRVASNGGHALQITTAAAAPYPGVLLEPREGPWDLSGFDAVEMDIHNPQDAAVRVLLSVNNPGADGQKNCNTESVSVPPRSKAVLSVPFGMWHGSPGHALDLRNIVSLNVFLDRPGQSHRFVVDNLRAVQFDRSHMDKVFADPFFLQLAPAFGRGINLGNALEAPQEGEWGVTLDETYFRKIKEAGFDSVRIPVRWSAHADKAAPYRIDPEFFARVDWAVAQALGQRLIPVLNMHHYDEIFQEPDKHRERFLALWGQIAERYKAQPPALAFELLNEPHAGLDAGKWNRLLADTLAVVRRTNPTRKVVIGPVGWNSIGELQSLVLPEEDRNLVVTVHYYSPFQFTHQGASWAGAQSNQWLGTKWTGTSAEKQAIQRDFDKAIAWAVQHRRPIYLGEFGAYSRADMESRARWTRFVAEEALQRKMGFAYWEFCSGFGAYDPQREHWVEPLKAALLGTAEGK
ncbi:MAG: cellulase family glycosylhydrolase [Pirellulaceae bacterium]|nr:cellulase family glycosylhydrolase [Pirellulaceae bacterium]